MKDKRGNEVRSGSPVKMTHREMIIFSVVNSELVLKVIKRIERMRGIFDST